MVEEERSKPEYFGDIKEEIFNLGRTMNGKVRVRTRSGMFEVKPGSRPPENSDQKPNEQQINTEEH
jgi:hypothetical protein